MLRRVAMISLLFMRRMSRGEWYVFGHISRQT
jgi:hypothetical protein